MPTHDEAPQIDQLSRYREKHHVASPSPSPSPPRPRPAVPPLSLTTPGGLAVYPAVVTWKQRRFTVMAHPKDLFSFSRYTPAQRHGRQKGKAPAKAPHADTDTRSFTYINSPVVPVVQESKQHCEDCKYNEEYAQFLEEKHIKAEFNTLSHHSSHKQNLTVGISYERSGYEEKYKNLVIRILENLEVPYETVEGSVKERRCDVILHFAKTDGGRTVNLDPEQRKGLDCRNSKYIA